jgi:hypothetical protein
MSRNDLPTLTIRGLIDLLQSKINDGVPDTLEVHLEGCDCWGECVGAALFSQWWQGTPKADPSRDFLMLERND